jgi:hypothetical protein
MSMTRSRLFPAALAFWWVAVFISFGPASSASFSQAGDIDALLDRIAERAKAHPEVKSWRAVTLTVATEMDKNWKPKKTTRIRKTVTLTESGRSEKVLEALRTEKGVTKDITEEVIREAEDDRREAKGKQAEKAPESGGEKDETKGMSRSLGLAELLPFNEKERQDFRFARLPDEELDGRTVLVLESKAKIKDEKFWEGLYFIDPESHNLLSVRLTISKNPKFVKELSTEIDFQILPDGHYFVKKTRMKINAGMVIKHIRMAVEEEYSDIEIL